MTDSIRHTFDEQLDELKHDVIRMGSMAAQAVDLAIRVLVEKDVRLSDRVAALENEIDALNLDIESRAIQMLALQQPMAKDLRLIAGILRMIADIERVGDYAMDTCRQARTLADQPLYTPLVDIPRMARLVQRMLHDMLEALVRSDLEAATAAVKQDDEVDRLYRTVHEDVARRIREEPEVTTQAIALLLIATYLERMADHVTNIGERIWFIETGQLKELHE